MRSMWGERQLAQRLCEEGGAWLDVQPGPWGQRGEGTHGWAQGGVAVGPVMQVLLATGLGRAAAWLVQQGEQPQLISVEDAAALLAGERRPDLTWCGMCCYEHGLPGLKLPLSAEVVTARWMGFARVESVTVDSSPPLGAGKLDVSTDCRDALGAGSPAWRVTLDDAAYERAVSRALSYIASGDCYQLNLTRRWYRPWKPAASDLADTYLRCRHANGAGFGGLLVFPAVGTIAPKLALLSTSPELFIRRVGDDVMTEPIKGTRRRGITGQPIARITPEADRAVAEALWLSEKERAELTMITDLLRNDLGRLSLVGSVRVAVERQIRPSPTVLHASSRVVAALRPGLSTPALLEAMLPGGSITGCPKRRAVEIMHELECGLPRGPYCGCFGWMRGSSAELAITIRTAVWDELSGELSVSAGAGIVADSDPKAEQVETRDKVCRLLAALSTGNG